MSSYNNKGSYLGQENDIIYFEKFESKPRVATTISLGNLGQGKSFDLRKHVNNKKIRLVFM